MFILASSFGLYEIIGIVLVCFMIGVTVMEIRAKKSSDLFTNIAIATIGVGVSIFTFVNDFRTKGSEEFFKAANTWIYLVVLLAAITFIIFFVINNKKYKDVKEEPKEESLPVEEENLTNEEIEEILEKENLEKIEEMLEKENLKEKAEIVEEVNPEKATEKKVTEKEGTTQVPKEQRNPFDK